MVLKQHVAVTGTVKVFGSFRNADIDSGLWLSGSADLIATHSSSLTSLPSRWRWPPFNDSKSKDTSSVQPLRKAIQCGNFHVSGIPKRRNDRSFKSAGGVNHRHGSVRSRRSSSSTATLPCKLAPTAVQRFNSSRKERNFHV